MTLIPVATLISRINARVGQGYCYGMYFKDLVTQNAIDAKAAQYPTVYNTNITYNGQTKLAKVWAQAWIDEYAGDCSGMIKAAYWTDENGDVIYKYLGRADTSANGMYNLATVKGPISTMPDTAGLLVHKNGHIGVYVGNGVVVEARGVAYGVVETSLTPSPLYNPRAWLDWCECPYVDYSTTPEPPEGVPDIYNANLVDEGLELGPTIQNAELYVADLSELAIVLMIGATGTSPVTVVPGSLVNSIYGQYTMLASLDADPVSSFIQAITGTTEKNLIAVFMAPNAFIGADDTLLEIGLGKPLEPPLPFEFTLDARPSNLNGYTPKNKKLLYYPYQYLNVFTGEGNHIIYKYEDFDGAPTFRVITTLIPGGNALLFAKNKLIIDSSESGADYQETLSINCYPTCLWSINEYDAWRAVHGVAEMISASGTVIGAGLGAAVALSAVNPLIGAAALAGGAMAIANTMAKVSEAEKIQPSQHGGFSVQYTISGNMMNTFFAEARSIKYMQAKRIDDYFEMYGYKTNEVKVPDLKSRPYWNYIKTANINITGNIPEEDKKKLRGIYDKGVTIWHDGNLFGDYTMNNHHNEAG
jgi:hypothetical protein